jgi:sulfate transport system ATP-binding protein
MSLSVEHINKRFGRFIALDRVSLDIADGELVALLGPSGSGKTTLLRILAGLEEPDSGTVRHDGNDLSQQSARQRNVGLVFQHYALFRHLSVFENIAFALRVRRRPQAEIATKVGELLRLIQLTGLEHRRPSQLSGGQRQRVALARALAATPRLLLLDEPFGALDAQVRHELRAWLRRLHDEIGVTTVLVTHDQEEALEVADRVVVMNRGRIEQSGTPGEVLDAPATDFVVRFFGRVNAFDAVFERGRAKLGAVTVEAPEHAHVASAPGRIYVRTHELDVAREQAADGNALAAEVTRVVPVGASVKLELRVDALATPLRAEVDWRRARDLDLVHGDRVWVSLGRARVFLEGDHATRP